MSRVRALSRRLVLPVVMGVALVAPLAGPADAAPPPLTVQQERVVLDLIDDICGDTWCEGDYAFDFQKFSCEQGSCSLRLRIAPYTDEALQWYRRTGQLEGFTAFDQMVVTSPSGYASLDPDFYAAVSDLVGRVEATVPTAP